MSDKVSGGNIYGCMSLKIIYTSECCLQSWTSIYAAKVMNFDSNFSDQLNKNDDDKILKYVETTSCTEMTNSIPSQIPFGADTSEEDSCENDPVYELDNG